MLLERLQKDGIKSTALLRKERCQDLQRLAGLEMEVEEGALPVLVTMELPNLLTVFDPVDAVVVAAQLYLHLAMLVVSVVGFVEHVVVAAQLNFRL